MTPPSVVHESTPKRVDGITWLLVGLVLLPLLVEAIRVLVEFHGYVATTDNAVNQMVVRDLGSHVALVGPYARADWSHPGPLFFYVMVLPYHLFGSNSAAMMVGALLVNAAALVTLITIGRRWGGLELAVPLAIVCALVAVRLPHGFLADPGTRSSRCFPSARSLRSSGRRPAGTDGRFRWPCSSARSVSRRTSVTCRSSSPASSGPSGESGENAE